MLIEEHVFGNAVGAVDAHRLILHQHLDFVEAVRDALLELALFLDGSLHFLVESQERVADLRHASAHVNAQVGRVHLTLRRLVLGGVEGGRELSEFGKGRVGRGRRDGCVGRREQGG